MCLLITFALVVQRVANRSVCEAGSERRQQQDQGQQQEPLYASESVEVGSSPCNLSCWLKGSIESNRLSTSSQPVH